MPARRIELVDALRAFALFGILQVNIQSFVWGAGDPLGYFLHPPSAPDAAVYLLVATFVSGKFIALFGLLFGLGFALQTRSHREVPGGVGAMYRRRLVFLFATGIAHGLLLYFGDILAWYAIGGALLAALYSDARPRALARGARRWFVAYAVLTVIVSALFEAVRPLNPDTDPTRIADDTLARLASYATAGYADQLAPRAGDYLQGLITFAMLVLPLVMGLFTLGALAGRQGWLAHPERHARLWRAATWIGIAALPVAIAGAWIQFRTMLETPGDPTPVGYALMTFGTPLVALYVALVVRFRETGPVRAAIGWLAPAGRMPLTNYLMQSMLMGILLSGWGFGLGVALSRAQLALLALAIVAVQIVASRAWIERFKQGPVEWLWRRATYG